MSRFWAGMVVAIAIAALAVVAYAADQGTGGPPGADKVVEGSVKGYRAILADDPKNLDARLAIADTYVAIGRPAKAIRELKKLIRKNRGREEALMRLGRIYEQNGQKRRAEKYYWVAAAVAPKNESALMALGRLALDRKDYRMAIKYLKRLTDMRPGLADGHYDLALAYEGLGRSGQARREYEAALRYIPDYQEAKEGLERVGAEIDR